MSYGQGGGYNKPQSGYGGGGYNKGGGYNAPPKKQFDLFQECTKYVEIYQALLGVLEANNIKLDDVKDYMGGWVSGIKISGDKLGN